MVDYHIDVPLEVYVCGAEPINPAESIDLTYLTSGTENVYSSLAKELFTSPKAECPITVISVTKDEDGNA